MRISATFSSWNSHFVRFPALQWECLRPPWSKESLFYVEECENIKNYILYNICRVYGSQPAVVWVWCVPLVRRWGEPDASLSGRYCDQIMSRNAVPATTLPGAAVAAQWNAVLKTTNVGQPWSACSLGIRNLFWSLPLELLLKSQMWYCKNCIFKVFASLYLYINEKFPFDVVEPHRNINQS